MRDHALSNLSALRHRLKVTRWRLTGATIIQRSAFVIAGLLSLGLLALTLEALLWLPPIGRLLLTSLLIATSIGGFLYAVLEPLARHLGWLPGLDDESLARMLGKQLPTLEDRLLNLLQLAHNIETPLQRAAIEQLAREVTPISFEQSVTFKQALQRWVYLVLPVVLLSTSLLWLSPHTFSSALERLLHPTTSYNRPLPFSFSVSPGDTQLIKGESLTLTVHAAGSEIPHQLTLHLQPTNERVQSVTIKADSTGQFTYTLTNVRQPLRYRVEMRNAQSPWYHVTVIERPLIRQFQLAVHPPEYTRLPRQLLAPNQGDFSALQGSRVEVTLYATGAVIKALVLFSDSTQIPLTLSGDQAKGTFTVKQPAQYTFLLENAQGVSNADPVWYTLEVIPDENPLVTLIAPGPTTDLPQDLQTTLAYRLQDDFGFSSLRLYYRLAYSRFGSPQETFDHHVLPLPPYQEPTIESTYLWDLNAVPSLELVPGDIVEYFLEVRDNDVLHGYKPARSQTWQLRVPSLAEQYEQLDTQQDSLQDALEDLLDESRTIRQEFEELRQELQRKQGADWEDKRQVDQLKTRERALQERLEKLTEQIEAITEEMAEKQLVDEETLQLYEELQRTFEEIKTPELEKVLQELQKALEQMNLQQMQKALEDFEFNESQYRQRLERTLELFKRIRIQQELQEIARRAEELAQHQERLQQATEKAEEKSSTPRDSTSTPQPAHQAEPSRESPAKESTPDQPKKSSTKPETSPKETAEKLAREQKQNAEEMRQLEQELDSLRKQMETLRHMPEEQLQELQEHLREKQLPQQMEQNSQMLQQQQWKKARQQQQQLQQQLQQLAQQLQQMQQQMNGQQLNINLAALRKALGDVLTLSMEQETLRYRVDEQAPDSPTLRLLARQQVNLSEGTSRIIDSLQTLAREIPQMTRHVQEKSYDALREMQLATRTLTDRGVAKATGHQKAAMSHLNELALLLSDLLDQLQQQSGSGGGMNMQQFMQQLKELSKQQQQLNEQIQQLLNDMQGNRLTESAQQRLQRLQQQQEAIRQQLEQLARHRELSRQILGDLDKIADQMEETIREMQQRRVDQKTIQRQREILTRLLQAQRSMRKRGKDRNRKAQSADDIRRKSPASLPPAEAIEQLHRDLLRALESGYAPDYEKLIREYFELLRKQREEK